MTKKHLIAFSFLAATLSAQSSLNALDQYQCPRAMGMSEDNVYCHEVRGNDVPFFGAFFQHPAASFAQCKYREHAEGAIHTCYLKVKSYSKCTFVNTKNEECKGTTGHCTVTCP